MAIIKSKVLGLYVLDSTYGQTTAFPVVKATNFDNSAGAAFTAGLDDGDYYLGVYAQSTGQYAGQAMALFELDGTSASPDKINRNDQLMLQLAATNTSLDISNTTNEVVAGMGSGSSSTFIVGGAQSWSFSADGFLTNEAADQVHSAWTSSSNKYYVVVKFATDVTTTGSKEYIGQGLIESFSLSGGFDDNIAYSITVAGYGDLYYKESA